MNTDAYVDGVKQLKDDPVWEDLEGDRPCKDPTVYTSSMLTTEADCSWRYYLRYVLGIVEERRNLGAVGGRAIHQAIHRTHQEDAWKWTVDMFRSEWQKAIDDPTEKDREWSTEVTEAQIDQAFLDAETMFRGYCLENGEAPVTMTEVPWRMIVQHERTKTRYRMAGTMDQILECDGVLGLRDIKSGKTMPNQAALQRSLQFTAYGLACKEAILLTPDGDRRRIGRFPDTIDWYHLRNLLPYKRAGKRSDGSTFKRGDLRGEPSIPISRTPQDYRFFQSEVCRRIQRIRFKLFTRVSNPTSPTCSMCRYQAQCTSDFVEDDLARTDLPTLANEEGRKVW